MSEYSAFEFYYSLYHNQFDAEVQIFISFFREN